MKKWHYWAVNIYLKDETQKETIKRCFGNCHGYKEEDLGEDGWRIYISLKSRTSLGGKIGGKLIKKIIEYLLKI